MRYVLDGSGYKADATATTNTAGCPSDGCKGYELTRNLDFKTTSSYHAGNINTEWTMGDGWEPIGTVSNPFETTFNGNDYTISNLMINRGSTDNIGLFGRVENGVEIANLGLLDVNIKGNNAVGSLIGLSEADITSSYATGSVSGSGDHIGGLAGWNFSGTITDSYATGPVSGSTFNVGGLVGSNGGTILNSHATGPVSGSGISMGGLVGHNTSTIENSYATGSVTGSNNNIGGLAGSMLVGTIKNSYATGSVTGNNNVGGLVGLTEVTGNTITNSYATGIVSGSGSNIGGLIGLAIGATISDSYWLSGSASSAGTNVPADTEKNAEMLKSPTTAEGIYGNWLSKDWDFDTPDQFPILKASADTLLPGQTMGLRSPQTSTVGAELIPAFVRTTTRHTIVVLPGTSSIDLTLTAYNTSATIALVKEGESTNYFANKASSESASIPIATNPVLIITVQEPDMPPIFHRIVVTDLPPCTVSLNTLDDNDGVDQALDIDKDGDSLIEICDVEGLDEIRHQLDGTGYTTSTGAMKITTGCSSTCTGFELTRSLDFMDASSYRAGSINTVWTSGAGWQPIGSRESLDDHFRAKFDGNGYTISNLMINRSGTSHIGLFGYAQPSGVTSRSIANLGLLNVNTTGTFSVGSLVGQTAGTMIINSYATGSVSGTDEDVGGLVGRNSATITNSYAAVSVTAPNGEVGGLVGFNVGGGIIRNSYATGRVRGSGDRRGGLVGFNESGFGGAAMIENSYATGRVITGSDSHIGGLVGRNDATINDSYWLDSSASSGGTGVNTNTSKTTMELISPIGAEGIYAEWDDPDGWDFGTANQFPALKYATECVKPEITAIKSDAAQPICGTLLPYQGMEIGDSGLRESLRELTIEARTTSNQIFGVSTNNYVVTIFLPKGITTDSIVLILRAYNPDAEIQIFKAEDLADYFAGRRSGDQSLPIVVGEGTKLTIMVSEPDTDYTLTFRVEEIQGIQIRVKVFLEGPLQ